MTGRHYKIDGDLRGKDGTKICRTCGTAKLLTDYYVNDAKRGYLKSECKPCFGLRMRALQKANRDAVNETARRYYWANVEAQRAAVNLRAQRHREQKRATGRLHYLANREAIQAQHRKYAKDHPEDPGRQLARNHRRRARLRGAFVADVDPAYIYERDQRICQLCKKKVTVRSGKSPMSASLDHIIPLSRGGTHEPKNVQLAHRICNERKNNRLVGQIRMFG